MGLEEDEEMVDETDKMDMFRLMRW